MSNRKDFVVDVATTIYINHLKTDNIDAKVLAYRSVSEAEMLANVLFEKELLK